MLDALRSPPAEMALRGRIGAYRLHATHDSRETTSAATATFLARFEREVDSKGLLPPRERERRALAARKAYFARLALQSARARSKGRVPKNGGAPVDQTGVAEAGGGRHGTADAPPE